VTKRKAGTVWIGCCPFMLAVWCGLAWAQQPIGAVGVQDATIRGALEVSNGRAMLVGSATVTANNHTAEVILNRGGSVRVCATSGLHATAGNSAGAAASVPLMLALDRGAIEVQMPATTSDVVMTPDLRFTLSSDGPLDLQLRVTRNGDTCVDNRGAKAPVVKVSEQFGDAAYELRAGQHVLFEHGSLKEVVDHERSSCGCPPEPAMTVADALLNAGAPATASADAAKTAAEQHPFPAAVSEGLAPVAAVPQSPPGVVHAQVSATLRSGDGPDSTTVPVASSPATPVSTAGAVAAQPPAAPPAAQRRGVFHAIGRFFRRIVGKE
jgi:hypothetical protein